MYFQNSAVNKKFFKKIYPVHHFTNTVMLFANFNSKKGYKIYFSHTQKTKYLNC